MKSWVIQLLSFLFFASTFANSLIFYQCISYQISEILGIVSQIPERKYDADLWLSFGTLSLYLVFSVWCLVWFVICLISRMKVGVFRILNFAWISHYIIVLILYNVHFYCNKTEIYKTKLENVFVLFNFSFIFIVNIFTLSFENLRMNQRLNEEKVRDLERSAKPELVFLLDSDFNRFVNAGSFQGI
jgi:hypothetical protein